MLDVLFFLALGLTVVAALLTASSGRRGDRRWHLVRAISTAFMLVATLILAFQLGDAYQFPPREMGIHFLFARSSAVLFLLVVGTGIALWKNPKVRVAHRVLVVLFLIATVSAVGTGVWVYILSTPKTG